MKYLFIVTYLLIGLGAAAEVAAKMPDGHKQSALLAVPLWPMMVGQLLFRVIDHEYGHNA